MAKEEEIVVVNLKLLIGSEDLATPPPEANVARREIINIPSQPARNFEAAGPSGLNPQNDMPVDELLNSNHPREMLPLFQENVPRGGPRFSQRDHKPIFSAEVRMCFPEHQFPFVSGCKTKRFSTPKCC